MSNRFAAIPCFTLIALATSAVVLVNSALASDFIKKQDLAVDESRNVGEVKNYREDEALDHLENLINVFVKHINTVDSGGDQIPANLASELKKKQRDGELSSARELALQIKKLLKQLDTSQLSDRNALRLYNARMILIDNRKARIRYIMLSNTDEVEPNSKNASDELNEVDSFLKGKRKTLQGIDLP
jgi:hypothetical protein